MDIDGQEIRLSPDHIGTPYRVARNWGSKIPREILIRNFVRILAKELLARTRAWTSERAEISRRAANPSGISKILSRRAEVVNFENGISLECPRTRGIGADVDPRTF